MNNLVEKQTLIRQSIYRQGECLRSSRLDDAVGSIEHVFWGLELLYRLLLGLGTSGYVV